MNRAESEKEKVKIVIDILELLYAQIKGIDIGTPYIETNIIPYKEIIKKGMPLDICMVDILNEIIAEIENIYYNRY